jgi:hypothetical protein
VWRHRVAAQVCFSRSGFCQDHPIADYLHGTGRRTPLPGGKGPTTKGGYTFVRITGSG